jgi:hypothetical protein
VKLKVLYLAFLLITLALLAEPISRPKGCSFFFFAVTVVQPSVVCELPARRMLSAGVGAGAAPNVSLSVGTMVKIGNNFGNACLAVFARSVSLALAGHPVDHDAWSPPLQAAQRLRDAGDMPAQVSVLWPPPQ